MEETKAAVGLIEFMRGLCLRLVVSELTQARYEGEFDRAAPAATGSTEQTRIAKQSQEFLRRRGEEARESLDAAFKMAEEHLATQEIKACSGVLAARLVRSVSRQIQSLCATLDSAIASTDRSHEQGALARALEVARKAAALLEELSSVDRKGQEEPQSADLGQVLRETFSLWCGEEQTQPLTGCPDVGLMVACRPSSLRAAFLTILQYLSGENGEADMIAVRCQAGPAAVSIEFWHEGAGFGRGSTPFSLDLARRIVTAAGGQLAAGTEAGGARLVCRVTLPPSPRSSA